MASWGSYHSKQHAEVNIAYDGAGVSQVAVDLQDAFALRRRTFATHAGTAIRGSSFLRMRFLQGRGKYIYHYDTKACIHYHDCFLFLLTLIVVESQIQEVSTGDSDRVSSEAERSRSRVLRQVASSMMVSVDSITGDHIGTRKNLYIQLFSLF